MLSLALAESLHRNARVKRCRSVEIGIAFDCIVNERGQLRVVKGKDPIRHYCATAMRTGPPSRDLRARRFRHDVSTEWGMLEHAAGKHEARTGPHNDSAIHLSNS